MKSSGRNWLILAVALMGCVAFSSCHSSRNSSRWEDPIYAKKDGKGKDRHSDSKTSVKTTGARQKVIDAACDWLGVPYKYGGNTRRGVDCSGLVCIAFESGANIKLPRSSSEQADYCTKISFNKAKPGDLIFFTSSKGGSRINHVAIYLGNDRVIHSTSSKGVIISNLNDEYWKSHYHCCGRAME